MRKIPSFRVTPLAVLALQVLLAVGFAIPAAQHAARSADGYAPLEVNPRRNSRSASLFLKRENTPVVPGTTQKLDIMIDSGGANVNTVSLTITAPLGIIHLDSLSFDRSFCTIITERTVVAASGSATISCGAPNPGLRTQIGTVASLFYTPQAIGPALFRIEPHTAQVLANDGFGSDVLKSTDNLAVTVQSHGGSAADTSDPTRVPLTSTTHTLGAACSTAETARFVWLPPVAGATFEYDLNTDPTSLVSSASTERTEVTLPTIQGTDQYFHVRAVIDGVPGPVSTVSIRTCGPSGTAQSVGQSGTAAPLGNPFKDIWSALARLFGA